jgi:hypothetical protein
MSFIKTAILAIWSCLAALAARRTKPRADAAPAAKAERRTVAMSSELAQALASLDPLTCACLLIISVVSGYLNYLSLADMFSAGMVLWQAKTAAAVLAISVGAVIMLFWSYMIALVPLDLGPRKRGGMFAAMGLGCGMVFLISSWMNAAALVGVQAQERDLALKLPAYQDTFKDAHRCALLVGQLAPFLQAEASRFAGMSKAEREAGALTGSRAPGAVTATLDQVSGRLTSLLGSIDGALKEAEKDAAQARAHLKAMQDQLSGVGEFAKRLSAFTEHAVAMDEVIARLAQRSVAPSIRHTAGALGSGLVMPTPSAKDGALAGRQAAAMAAIEKAVTDIGARLATAAAEIETCKPAEVPAFSVRSRADAVTVHAASFLPGWGVAVALDLMPAVIVLVLTIARAGTGDSQAPGAAEAAGSAPRKPRRATARRQKAAAAADAPTPEFEEWLERRPGDGRSFGNGAAE